MSALAVAHSAAFSRWEADQNRADAMARHADELLGTLRSGNLEQAAGELQLAMEGNPSFVLAACRIVVRAGRGEFPQADALRLFMDCADDYSQACVRAAA